jgi:hypothetical protein
VKGSVRGDHTAGASCTVRVIGWADKKSFLAFLKLADALVPALDDLTDADFELERVASLHRRVENAAV